MASGRMSAHSKISRPGNLYATTSQPSAVPSTSVPAPTPRSRASVLTASSTSCVCHRCCHTSTAGWAREESTETSGTASSAPMAAAAAAHTEGRLLLVAGAIGELDRGRLELAGRRDVDVVLPELAPARDDRIDRGLGINGVFEGDVGEHLLRFRRGQELDQLDGGRTM